MTPRAPITDILLTTGAALVTGLYTTVAIQTPTWYSITFALIHLGLTTTLATRTTTRRSSFIATYALLAAMATLMWLAPINLGVSPLILCAPLSLYKIARHDPPAWSATALLLGIAGSFVSPLEYLPGGNNKAAVPLLILCMVGTYLWAAGRRRTELTYATELRRAEEQHRRDLDRRVQQAQTDERARIAREIHDIVAHSLAVVNVQAATALAIGTENQMRQSLTTIKDASKDAITQMRSLVKVLREKQDSEVSGDLHRLITLTEQAQTTGVNLEHNLDPATLTDWQNRWPAAARLALIRAVQEGISNVIKHGGTTPHAHLNITEKTTPATYI
ncbi:histidine kinase [Dermatophilus congolensis]|uniref:histidine kinase n=1 Tax=Dermatophilus congolensis TaxID=1863 RepID=UPI001AAF3E9D|nr:hypothetical protein [Dermatophilus congolensis]MBO3151011.1 hypothetical protein [Dermatophilus congolensis]MBO3161984.1 hypothetical protein [Dermatophilus congolensis]MBO3162295.1 hypothetical protein [Dermatophilus congolensis]MBO3175849.1 hypothetical protein [Dermatophilus congolensis]